MGDPFLGSIPGATGAGLVVLALLVKATLILGAAWTLQRLFRRASAAVRHGIWSMALLAVVALPVAPLWLPTLRVDLSYLPAETSRPAVAAPPLASSSRPLTAPSSPVDSPTEVAGGAAPVAEHAGEATAQPLGSIDWALAALLLWAAGAALRLAWLALQFARVRRLSAAARAEGGRPLALPVEELTRRLGIRRPVRVIENSRVSMPLTWGTVRPVILLPRQAREWPEGRLRVVLLHELAHIRRWDYLTYLLAEVACAAYWPVPLVWLARRRVQVEQEQACDDLVLASGTGSLEYAEHLLGVARAFYGNRRELGATVSMAREISLKDRIRTILDDRTNRRPLLSGSGVLVLLLLAGFTLPVAAVRPGPARTEPDAAAPGDDGTTAPARPPAPAAAAVPSDEEAAAPVFLWLESEQGVALVPMELREDLDASSGAYLMVPDGQGNDAPGGGEGEVRFSIDLPRTGDYYLWGRVIGANDNDNSLYVSVDAAPEVAWHLARPGGALLREWGWVPLAGAEAGEPAPLRLAAGTRELRLRNREDGTRLDRVLVTSDPAFVPSGRGPAAVSRPTYRWMDGADALLDGAIRWRRDEQTTSGRYISLERGRGAEADGTATFVFDVDRAGRYVVWGRVLAPSDAANSFHVSLDGGAEVVWDAPERDPGSRSGWWSWSALNAREYAGRRVDPLLLDLRPGRHELRVRTREAGTRLDGLLVTDDLEYRPRGVWPGNLPARPVRVTLQAEDARLSAPLTVRADSAAGGGRYLAADGRGSTAAPPTAGSAVLRFSLEEAGLYGLWARTLARNTGEDSFWLRVNGGRWIRWNAIPPGRSWRWSMVHDADREREVTQFQLEPGDNTIEIAHREAGARLDELVITNDPLFQPGTSTDR